MRLMVWNIQKFTFNKFMDTARRDAIMQTIDPLNGTAADVPDIMAVLEVYDNNGYLGGPVAGQGGGGAYLLWREMYNQLGHSWKIVPPLGLTYSQNGGGRAEGIAVFYNTNRVTFQGPNVWTAFGSMIPGNGVNPINYTGLWSDNNAVGNQLAGRLRYFLPNGNEINFPNFVFRRPWMTRFLENATNTVFDLFFYHSTPADGNNVAGTQSLVNIPDLVNSPNTAVVCGDFNVDANSNNDFNNAYGGLQAQNFAPLITTNHPPTTTIRRVSFAFPTNYLTGNSYDNILVKPAPMALPAVTVVDLVTGAPDPPYISDMDEDIPTILANYAGAAAQNNAFRQFNNYQHIRRTSDHLALAVTL